MLILIFIIEILLTKVPNEVSVKSKYINLYPTKINTLILGNSQAYMGLKPSILGDSVINTAYYQKSPYYDYHLLKNNIHSFPNLKCVIWNISVPLHDFNGQHITNIERDFKNYAINKFYKYDGIGPIGFIKYPYWFETIWSGYEGPVIMRLFNKNKFDFSERGWASYDSGEIPENHNLLDIPRDIDKNDISLNKQREKILLENIEYACQLARLCDQNGIRLIVVTIPTHKSFYENVSESELQEIRDCIASMRCINPKLEFYEYLKDSRFNANDYFDATHLSKIGAEKFSNIFKNEVLDNG